MTCVLTSGSLSCLSFASRYNVACLVGVTLLKSLFRQANGNVHRNIMADTPARCEKTDPTCRPHVHRNILADKQEKESSINKDYEGSVDVMMNPSKTNLRGAAPSAVKVNNNRNIE